MSISDSQNDTSVSWADGGLPKLLTHTKQAPFTQLIDYIECLTGDVIEKRVVQDNYCCAPDKADTLQPNVYSSQIRLLNHLMGSQYNINFVPQNQFTDDPRYYEQIIFEERNIPTRVNWHDFFNGIIWCQFPLTKQYLNRQHQHQIKQFGLKQRSAVRDRITHFDECGLLLFSRPNNLVKALQNHAWTRLFIENKTNWHTNIIPVIFGHALWEMLMQPFIGLTAKVYIIELEDNEFDSLHLAHENMAGLQTFYQTCDEILLNHVTINKKLHQKRPWLPMPLLGIPGWSTFVQDDKFYSNQDYFMPVSPARK